jgi:hypothetical protein
VGQSASSVFVTRPIEFLKSQNNRIEGRRAPERATVDGICESSCLAKCSHFD